MKEIHRTRLLAGASAAFLLGIVGCVGPAPSPAPRAARTSLSTPARLRPRPGAVVRRGRGPERQEVGVPVVLTEESFHEHVARGVWLVDFWAEWCPPCRTQGPIVDGIARRFAGRASVGRVDVVTQQGVAANFAVTAIPTLIILRNGTEARRMTGLQSEETLARALEAALRGQ